MKILVTVGTTSFDSLICFLDNTNFEHNYEFVFQIADGEYIPNNYPFFRFEANLWERFENHVVITHCGAGTVYYLLENRFNFIVVPNLERIDKHQLDLAEWVKMQNYATVAFNFNELGTVLNSKHQLNHPKKSYIKTPFFKGSEISDLLNKGNLNV